MRRHKFNSAISILVLDYVLLSPALAARDSSVEIIRRGLPYRVPLDPRAPDRSIARASP